jgi:hypothetical protein
VKAGRLRGTEGNIARRDINDRGYTSSIELPFDDEDDCGCIKADAGGAEEGIPGLILLLFLCTPASLRSKMYSPPSGNILHTSVCRASNPCTPLRVRPGSKVTPFEESRRDAVAGPGCADVIRHNPESPQRVFGCGVEILTEDMKDTNQTASYWRSLCERAAASQSAGVVPMTDDVEDILKYLREAGGYTIDISANLPVKELKHGRGVAPVDEDQALVLLKEAVGEVGCKVLQKGRLLRIITAHEAKKHFLPLPTIQSANAIQQRTA